MTPKWFILMALGFLLFLCAIPYLAERFTAVSKARSVEASYERFAAGNTDSLNVAFDAMLVNKVAANSAVANRVRSLVILDGDFAAADFSELQRLPNLEQIVIYSGRNCDDVIPTINRLKGLKTITFADCGLNDPGLDQLNHPGITSLQMSSFTRSWSDQTVDRLKERMPQCEFEATAQE